MKRHRNGRGDPLNLGWLDELSVLLAIGFAIGFALFGLLRWLRLRWTWSFMLAPLVPLAAQLGWRPAVLVGAIALVTFTASAGRTFVVCREGGIKRLRERRRVGPCQLAWRLLRLRNRREKRIAGDRLAVGQTRDLRLVEIPFGASRAFHGLLLGATDGGKTVTATSIAHATVRIGNAAIVVEPKTDHDMQTTLEEEARRCNVPFFLWTTNGPYRYNVAHRGGPSEIADKVLSGHDWSEPHYLSIALRFTQTEVAVLKACGVAPSLASISEHMQAERLEALAAASGQPALMEQVGALTSDMPKRLLDELAGARSRIALLAEAEFAEWLLPSENGLPEIDLARVIESGGVAYFRLEADRHPQMGSLLAAALVVDLITLSAELQGARHNAALVLDEFAALGADKVSRLFATARSAGLSVLLATQGLADLREARDSDTLIAQVIQNVSYVIAHRISDPEAAQLLAETAGTFETWTLTQEVEGHVLPRRTGSGSKIPTHEFLVHPNEFKTLRQGEAIVIELGRRLSAERARIWRPFP